MRKLLLIVSCSCFVCFAISCSSKAPKLKLSRVEKIRVDSLFKLQVPELDSLLDEQCSLFNESNYQSMKDSIISVRLEEIQDILPK